MRNKKAIAHSSSTLASVKKEMSKPRVVHSARPDPNTAANGGRVDLVSHDEAAAKGNARKALNAYAKAVGI